MNVSNLDKVNDDKRKMIEKLHGELEWYTKEASEEEFDPKAVESILYLLDIYEPLQEAYTNVDEAWEHFEQKMTEKERVPESECKTAGKAPKKKYDAIMVLMQKRKIIVAAVLVILLLAFAGTTQVEAIKKNGFFFWLRQDDEGRQMITVPKSLESTLSSDIGINYYEKNELPPEYEKWADWEIVWNQDKVFQWGHINVMQMDNFEIVESYYTNIVTEEWVAIGVISYAGKVSINTELFEGYSYVQSYGEASDSFDIYQRMEENGNINYRVCKMDGNHIYFVEGKELELLKELIKKY